jgi:hypothetical protein
MRSASLVGALEAARAMLSADLPGGRRIVASVLQRADEPGEALAYWMATYGRSVPKPVKRGIADAVTRLYTERALLKYDTASHGFRFGDVVDLVHPFRPTRGRATCSSTHSTGARTRGRASRVASQAGGERGPAQTAAADLAVLRDSEALSRAGMTWEDALSLCGWCLQGTDVGGAHPDDGIHGAAAEPAQLRRRRSRPTTSRTRVAARLADPDEVARSRQFPYRFLAAYEQAPSLRWGPALDRALQLSLANLPALPGRSLILVDTSASMSSGGFSSARR